jgi:hypothetical protein
MTACITALAAACFKIALQVGIAAACIAGTAAGRLTTKEKTTRQVMLISKAPSKAFRYQPHLLFTKYLHTHSVGGPCPFSSMHARRAQLCT